MVAFFYLQCDIVSDFQVMPSHYTQNHGRGKACVYKLGDYGTVLKCLKSAKNVDFEEIPWATFNVIEKLSNSFVTGRWTRSRSEHLLMIWLMS